MDASWGLNDPERMADNSSYGLPRPRQPGLKVMQRPYGVDAGSYVSMEIEVSERCQAIFFKQ